METTIYSDPMIEVFSVRILKIDGEHPVQLYGTIKVGLGALNSYFFNRSRAYYESISRDEYVTLTGPSRRNSLPRAITADDPISFEFNLMDGGSPSGDYEISRGFFEWNTFIDYPHDYNVLRTNFFSGKHGSAALNWVLISAGVEALLEIILINGNGQGPADVYGRIYCQNSKFDEEIQLFRSSAENHINVQPGSPIPLLRSALAVPIDATLRISAHLWDHSTISSDVEIVRGSAEFETLSASQFIEGRHGKVEVRINWKRF